MGLALLVVAALAIFAMKGRAPSQEKKQEDSKGGTPQQDTVGDVKDIVDTVKDVVELGGAIIAGGASILGGGATAGGATAGGATAGSATAGGAAVETTLAASAGVGGAVSAGGAFTVGFYLLPAAYIVGKSIAAALYDAEYGVDLSGPLPTAYRTQCKMLHEIWFNSDPANPERAMNRANAAVVHKLVTDYVYWMRGTADNRRAIFERDSDRLRWGQNHGRCGAIQHRAASTGLTEGTTGVERQEYGSIEIPDWRKEGAPNMLFDWRSWGKNWFGDKTPPGNVAVTWQNYSQQYKLPDYSAYEAELYRLQTAEGKESPVIDVDSVGGFGAAYRTAEEIAALQAAETRQLAYEAALQLIAMAGLTYGESQIKQVVANIMADTPNPLYTGVVTEEMLTLGDGTAKTAELYTGGAVQSSAEQDAFTLIGNKTWG